MIVRWCYLIFTIFLIWFNNNCYSQQKMESSAEIISPVISPDGKYIVYHTKTKPKKINRWVDEILELLLLDIKSQEIYKITTNTHDAHPTWSPSSDKIVYCSSNIYTDKPKSVFVVFDVRRKTKEIIFEGRALYPVWSPVEDVIMYLDLYKFDSIISLLNLSDKKIFHLVNEEGLLRAGRTWSANGRQIFFSRQNKGIWSINRDGTKLRQIFHKFEASYLAPSFDNKYILAIPYKNRNDFASNKKDSLWTIEINNPLNAYSVLLEGSFISADWAYDSNKVLVCKKNTANFDLALSKHSIYLFDINNKNFIKLTTGDYSDDYAYWIPNQSNIIFRRNKRTLWIMNVDGTDQKQIFPKL